jgi:hypothetical protein
VATVTAAVQQASTSNAASYTSNAFTPAVGDLLVAVGGLTGTTATDWILSDSQGGTWTKIRRQVKASSADFLEIWVRDQLIASATSTTLTFSHASGNATGVYLRIWRVSGMARTGADAIRSQGGEDNHASGSAPAPTLDQNALTDNPTLTAIFNATNTSGVTGPSGWTVSTDTGYASPTTGARAAHRDSGFTGTTITWGSTSASNFCSLAVELDGSSAAGFEDDVWPAPRPALAHDEAVSVW